VNDDEGLAARRGQPGPYDTDAPVSGDEALAARQREPGPYDTDAPLRDDSPVSAREADDVRVSDESVRDDPRLQARRDQPRTPG
jgi:hypothetical protein